MSTHASPILWKIFSSLGLAFVTLKKIIDNKRTTYYIIPDNKTLSKSNFTFILFYKK
jgi:hypothetical protein